jgi:hypothetical protein
MPPAGGRFHQITGSTYGQGYGFNQRRVGIGRLRTPRKDQPQASTPD